MRTSLVVGFAVVAQSPALLVCVLGGAIEGDDSYCDSYQDDQVYTAESCGSYDSTACMGQCTSDAGSWCNSLCGTGTETCMDGSGAVCAISALANIVDTCSTVRSATTAAVESTEELVYGGQKGIATSGSVASSVSDSDGAPETTETTTGSMEGANVHLQSCGKGCTETKYDDDVDPTSTFANGAVASSANGGLEPGRRARRLGADKLGAPKYDSSDRSSDVTTDDRFEQNGQVVVNAHGCDEHVYCVFCDATCEKVMNHYAKKLWGVQEWGKAYNRMGSGPMAMLLLNDIESLCDLVTTNITDFITSDAVNVASEEDVGIVGDGVAAAVGVDAVDGSASHYIAYSVAFLAGVGVVGLYVYVRRARNAKAPPPSVEFESTVSLDGVAVDPSKTWAIKSARKAALKQDAYGAI